VWPLKDPLQIELPAERTVTIRQVRDEIRRRVIEFIAEHA
jgi:hypothetical protein